MNNQQEKYIIIGILLLLAASYSVLVFLSEGTVGGADDMTHYRYARYAFQNPYFFIHHWGKPFFTALTAPFAQFGWNGIRIFNVLAGTATAYFTYRTARLLNFSFPWLAIFLVISSPLYTVMMLSGMTEILCSLVLILSIFLFYRRTYIWSALILSFIPFVRTEAFVIIPLFLSAFIWLRRFKAIPFLFVGFVFYSVAGSFHFNDIFWVIHEMPYKGGAEGIYGSGPLLHYVKYSRLIFGWGLKVLIAGGLLTWIARPVLDRGSSKKDWLIEMLVVYLPFIAYFSAHSYVWWRGTGNSIGLIRVMAAIIPSAALLALLAWSTLWEWIRIPNKWKLYTALAFSIFLVIIPHLNYQIPVPLEGEQKLVKEASDWLKSSEHYDQKIYYYDPFFSFFLDLNPYDEERSRAFVHNREAPEYNVPEGGIVIWDAHYSPNEGRLLLERLMDNPHFKLIYLHRWPKPFKVLGGYDYEIYMFQRISGEEAVDNHAIYDRLLQEIMERP